MESCYDMVSSNSPEEHNLPPIIFLHGMIDCRRSWKKVAPIISRKTGRKTYALDARNHGENQWLDEMNYESLTKDVKDFMDGKGIRKAIIVGHSMGGRTAINFALMHPGRTDALVIEDMTPRDVNSGFRTFVSRIFYWGRDYIENLPPEMGLNTAKKYIMDALLYVADDRYVDAKKLKKHYDLDMGPMKKVGNKFVVDANLDAVVSMLESNALIQNLPEKDLAFNGDALFLYGSKPFFNIAEDTSIDKLFPRALKVKIEGASHLIHLDSPYIFAQVVSDFIVNRNLPKSKY